MNAVTSASDDACLRNSTIASYVSQLRERGYVVIPNAMELGLVEAIDHDLSGRFEQTPFCEGLFYGSRTKRFGKLLVRSSHAAAFVEQPTILAIVEEILKPWCDVIQLNLTQAVEVHPGSPEQVPHRDQDMWAGPKGDVEYLVNVMWPTTTYTKRNGATIVWPDSHEKQDEMILPSEDSIDAEMEPGSALLYLGSTLHSAGCNSSPQIRRGMIISYSLGWLKPYENQFLAYPPEVARHFDPALAALVGYRQHRPNLGNYEGQCPSVLLRSDVPDNLHAIDELRPDQVAMIEAYRSGALPVAA